MSDDESHLLELCQQLLDSIDRQDWSAYTRLCDPNLTAFEPEAVGHLVEGMPFHEFYFRQSAADGRQSTISAPRIALYSDVAVVTYVRLVQRQSNAGGFSTTAFDETRIWHRRDGEWQHVHFHRSEGGRA